MDLGAPALRVVRLRRVLVFETHLALPCDPPMRAVSSSPSSVVQAAISAHCSGAEANEVVEEAKDEKEEEVKEPHHNLTEDAEPFSVVGQRNYSLLFATHAEAFGDDVADRSDPLTSKEMASYARELASTMGADASASDESAEEEDDGEDGDMG